MWTKGTHIVFAIKGIAQNKHCTDYMLIVYVKWELIKHIFTIKFRTSLNLKGLKQVQLRTAVCNSKVHTYIIHLYTTGKKNTNRKQTMKC